MKKVISALTAAAMCASMSAGIMTAFAAFSHEDMSLYLKVVEDSSGKGVIDGNTITFKSGETNGAVLTLQEFIDCDVNGAQIQQVGSTFTTNSTNIKLGDPVSYSKNYTEKTYTLANGTTFTTDLFPCCFGWWDSDFGEFNTGSQASTGTNADWGAGFVGNGDNDVVLVNWASSFDETCGRDDWKTTAAFMDSKSDTLPFFQFTATLGDLADGVYEITFLDEWTHGEFGKQIGNYVNTEGKSSTKYALTKHTGIKIVVGDATEETTQATEATDKPTEAPTTEPTTAPTDKPTDAPTQPATGSQEEISGRAWYMKDYVVEDLDAFAAKPTVTFPIYSNGDTGTFGYSVTVLADGKSLKERFAKVAAKQQGATKLSGFVTNYDESIFGASESEQKGDHIFADGDTIMTFSLTIKDEDIQAAKAAKAEGKEYKIDLSMSDLTVGNYAQESFAGGTDIKMIGASIILASGASDPTEEPTEATTDKPTEPPTEGTTAPVTGDYLYGDVNENGTVELVDVVMLNRYLTKYENQALTARAIVNANCLRNGETDEATKASDLNGKDSVEILKFLIGSVKTLPTQAK